MYELLDIKTNTIKYSRDVKFPTLIGKKSKMQNLDEVFDIDADDEWVLSHEEEQRAGKFMTDSAAEELSRRLQVHATCTSGRAGADTTTRGEQRSASNTASCKPGADTASGPRYREVDDDETFSSSSPAAFTKRLEEIVAPGDSNTSIANLWKKAISSVFVLLQLLLSIGAACGFHGLTFIVSGKNGKRVAVKFRSGIPKAT